MGNNEDPDIVIREAFENYGFSVTYEDIGARRTIFDNYDRIDHFRRIENFIRIFSSFDNLNTDIASDLTHSLEELHPKLFDSLFSAARAIQLAETEEDYAQAALSGRRLLEQIADYLFPPSNAKLDGRKVGAAQHKNRLWAYIKQIIKNEVNVDVDVLMKLGQEVDRLFVLFNKGLHSSTTQLKLETAFADLVIWLSNVIQLSPNEARKPYLAYQETLTEFIRKV